MISEHNVDDKKLVTQRARAVAMGVVLQTSFVHPPIPIRTMDWIAVTDNYDCDCDEEGFFSHDPVGYGRTEAEAIEGLLDQIEEDES